MFPGFVPLNGFRVMDYVRRGGTISGNVRHHGTDYMSSSTALRFGADLFSLFGSVDADDEDLDRMIKHQR